MVMEYWQVSFITVFTLCSCISPITAFDFQYLENRDAPVEVLHTNFTLVGSHASLGNWPHWCLGNVAMCTDGFTLTLYIKFTAVREDTPELVIISNGGHSPYANGFYLLQRYGDEYEFGVTALEQRWSVRFRLVPELFVTIAAKWDVTAGLHVTVDGVHHEDSQGHKRTYLPMAFQGFQDVMFGLDADDTAHTVDERFTLVGASLLNWRVSANYTAPNDLMDGTAAGEDQSWLGCGTFSSTNITTVPDPATAVMFCRGACTAGHYPVSAVRAGMQCSCTDAAALDHAFQEKSACAGSSTYWHFYAASALASRDSDYTITVTVDTLGTRAYVKPLEAVLVRIDTNFHIELPFTVDFGDGTFMDIDTDVVSYFWLVEGNFEITVSTRIGIAEIEGRVEFTVEDVDEGRAGDFVMLHTYHGQSSLNEQLEFTSIDYAPTACDISYGDRMSNTTTDVHLRDLTEYVENREFGHDYANFGNYDMTVNCTNPYGKVRNHTDFIAQKFETTFHYHESETHFATTMAGSAEFLNDVQVDHSDSNITVTLARNESTVIIQPRFLQLQENYLYYRHEDTGIDRRILYVQNIVGMPEIRSFQFNGAWNLTTNITVRVPPGNNMFLNVSFSAGEDQLFYIHYLQYRSDVVFEVMFPSLGYYHVLANVSNDISFNTAETLVSVEVPIRNITLSVNDITDKVNPVELKIYLNEGNRGPAKVNFELDQGNGFVDTYFHQTNFFNIYQHDYYYSDWGAFEICVTAYNEISSVHACISVQVGQYLTYVEIMTPTTGRYAVNESAEFIIRCPRGSDKTYIVDFDDGETFIFTDRYLKETEWFPPITTEHEEETTLPPVNTTAPSNMKSNGTLTGYATSTGNNNTSPATNTTFNGTTTASPVSPGNSTAGSSNTTTPQPADTQATNSTTALPESTTDATEASTLLPGQRRRRREVGGSLNVSSSASSNMSSTADTDSTTGQTSPLTTTTLYTDSSTAPTTFSNVTGGNTTRLSSTPPTVFTTNQTFQNISGNNSHNNMSGNITTTSGNVTQSAGNATSLNISTTIPTTTTTMAPTTTEPIPDDATNPLTTNHSTARRLRDGTIEVKHRYNASGTYTVRVKSMNHFNYARDTLCPPIIVGENDTSECQLPELALAAKMQSSLAHPLQFIRSEQINLTSVVRLHGCGESTPLFSWRTTRVVEEDGAVIERPYYGPNICLQDDAGKVYRYNRSSLPFGTYRVLLTVSPSGHPLKASLVDFYMTVKPSPPNAIIQGNDEHRWFLIFGTTIVRFFKSVDPDFDTHEGVEYDLVCMHESDKSDATKVPRQSMISSSTLVKEGVTYKYTTKNPIRLYEYSNCFTPSSNLTNEIRFAKGEFNVPSEYFISDVTSFAMRLFVTKNDLTSDAWMTFEIRLSNSSNLLDQLDDLLSSNDTTGVMRAVEQLTAGLLDTSGNGTEEEDFEANAEKTELKTKLIGALDQVSAGVKDVGQASGMLGLVDDLTKDASSTSDSARVSATGAIKNSAKVTEEFIDEPMDTLTGVGQQVVSGVSNVLPKEDEMAKKLAEHEKAKEIAEKEAAEANGQAGDSEDADPNNDGADITLDDDEPDSTTELTEDEKSDSFKGPLVYNKLLKKCDLLHNGPLDKLYKYLMFYESIFRFAIKNYTEQTMINADILSLKRNDIFCYLGITEEPGDVEWYVNRFCDQEKRRRDLLRKNADRDVSKSFLGAIDSVSSVLLNKTESNQTVELAAPGLNVAMKKLSPNDTEDSGGDAMANPGGGVKMPTSALATGGNDSDVGQTMITNDNSPFTYANENDTSDVGTSVITFKLTSPGTPGEVSVSNTTEPIEIYLAGNPERVQTPQLFTLFGLTTQVDSVMNYHSINVTKNDTTMHIIVRPEPISTAKFDLLLQYEDYPNETHHIAMATLPRDAYFGNISAERDDVLQHTFFPDPSLTQMAGIYKVGVKMNYGEMDFTETEFRFNYTWQMFMGGCLFWNPENETWDSDGCVVGNLTTSNSTQCLCTHLTSFGGEMVVPPNTIDFNNVWAKFKNLNENAAVFSTVIALLGIYVILLIWARHMDKKDIAKWGATPLEDNLPTDSYHYQLSVTTGMKKQAATKSAISLVISGETCDTGVRQLFDGKRHSHEQGSIRNYILSVERNLGPLSFLRIWHDNTGAGKLRSWFLDQIEVTDLQTGERYFFLCHRWLAVEEDDGMVDRVLPVAGLDDLVAFKQLFTSNIRKKLTSDHLWVSVFSRPTRSSFTRVQRISCCMSLLFLTMITNAMWFKSDSEGDTNTNQQVVALKVGPFSFTLQQVFISFASTIIVFPPSFLLVTLFRRTKQKKNSILQTNVRRPKRGRWKNLDNNQTHSAVWGAQPKSSKLKKFQESISALLKGNNKSKYGASGDDEEESSIPVPTIAGDRKSKEAAKRRKKPFMFPFWCNYIAWILCFFSVIAPAFFTILYSMEWGSTKANEWLTTFLLSFFQSVIVVQPIKVLALVAFIACVLKKPDLDEEGDCSDELNNAIAAQDEVLATRGQSAVDEIAAKRKQANAEFEPPDMEALAESRETRMKEMKMEDILKEILVYGFFVVVLFFLSYQQRDKESFQLTDNLRNMFTSKFKTISTKLEYWVWLETIFLPTLYIAKFHNGTELVTWWDKRCVHDFQSRRVGIARMRQHRVKENSCTIVKEMRPVIDHCRNEYNWYDDDGRAYMPGWVKTSKENETILDDLEDVNPWVYQNSYRLKNAPYVATLQTYKGGGYVMNFERSYRRTVRNATRLRSENWLDLRTRAVFLEFTIYNPNSNLYASAVMVSEFPASGAAVHRSEFKVFRLQSYVGGFAIVIIFFEVLYCCFTLYFFVRCVRKVRKERCKYFRTFWDILEFSSLCFAVTCIAMYAFKHILTEVAMRSLKKQSKAEYINFQSLAMYDEFYGYMTAIVVFLASIQFLKLLQFNKKMNMLGDTVKLATKDLKVFSIAAIIYFMAFVILGYLLFGKYMVTYNGIVQCMESSFAFTLGSFDFQSMEGSHKILGPIYFFLFIAVIYVGLMSIFLTIIADAFNTVKANVTERSNEYEMVDFMWRRFKGLIGVK